MRVLYIQKYGRAPVLKNTLIPERKAGQLLIGMKYAPINPSDLHFYLGRYGIKKDNFPIMGFQGSGIVYHADDASLKGKTVSVLANMTNGTYGEYICSNMEEVIVWPTETSLSQQQISMCMINPLSVLGMLNLIEETGVKTILLSAATSNTSKMLTKLIKKTKPDSKVLGMSRSQKYDTELLKMGYDRIFRMEQTTQLQNQLINHQKTMFLDCVGGSYAGRVFNTLPPQSTMVNYGRLSQQNLSEIDLGGLYYRDKRIRGFWLSNYLRQINGTTLAKIKSSVVQNSDLFKQKIRKVYPMEEYQDAMRASIKDQSEGKILLSLAKE